MQAVKHNPDFAKKVDVPQTVAQEFIAADKRAPIVAALRRRP
jgi:hypothetical protein